MGERGWLSGGIYLDSKYGWRGKDRSYDLTPTILVIMNMRCLKSICPSFCQSDSTVWESLANPHRACNRC